MESNRKEFWDQRWQNNETGWDIGYASPALLSYLQQVNDKSIRILIPGCGNAYEAKAFWELGFKNITLIDISPFAVEKLKKELASYEGINIYCEDFFQHIGEYDLIIEQTFFCAILPEMRISYVKKIHELLTINGRLVGLLFGIQFEKEGPPFGGSLEEYQQIFSPFFNIKTMENCSKSIPQRNGNELFINLIKK